MKKLIICIDGLGYDFISKENTPFLYEFGKKNHFSELETLFAFTGLEYCFFSGKTPEKSNIWLEFSREDTSVFDSFLMKIFGFSRLKNYIAAFLQLMNKRTWMSGIYHIPRDKLKYFDTSAKKGLWELDFFRDKKFAVYKWPFFALENKKRLIFKYENDEDRLKRILSKKNKEIYYTQLMKVDKAIHKFGKKSPEAKKAIFETDRLLKLTVGSFLKENPNGEVFLWSDHGFANIKNYIDIEKLLLENRDYLYFIEGTTASFWFNNEGVKKRILNSLKKENKIKILNKKDAQKYKIPLSKRYGDLIIYVEKGNYFFPNFYQKSEKEKFAAMHGYPEDKELNGFFITNTKKDRIIKKSLKMDEVLGIFNMIRLNLGCGKDIRNAYINLDKLKFPGIDVVHDLNKIPYPFEENSVDEILSFHILEHICDYEKTMNELSRILKKGGILKIKVPHFTAAGAFSEFHKRFFWYNSFTSKRLCHETSLETQIYDNFKTLKKRINFIKWPFFWNFLLEIIINLPYMPQIYEHTFLHSLFPAKEIEITLKKI